MLEMFDFISKAQTVVSVHAGYILLLSLYFRLTWTGNLGNLPIIIIPAICKDKGSPFGDSDVCYRYGMAYASLSMAVGAVYIWTYVYNIMRVSARIVPKESYRTSSFKLEASGEILELPPEEESKAKDSTSDSYSLLLSSIESEQNVKVPISTKIKHIFGKLLVNNSFRAIFSPATLGAVWYNVFFSLRHLETIFPY